MRYVLFIFLAFVLSLTLISQKEYKSLFWKIYGNGLSDTSYLYGTMHSKDTRVFQFKDGVIEAFNRSDIYAMELNIDSVDQLAIVQGLIMDSSYTLKTLLNEEEYSLIDKFFKDSVGISLLFFNKIQPLYTSQMISLQNMGNQQTEALDIYFFNEAKRQDKITVGLEQLKEQINAFNSIPYEIQAKELVRSVVENSKDDILEMEKLIEWYVKGDLDKLLEMTLNNESSNKEISKIINDEFLIKRNKKMADRSETLIKIGSVFIAIGAAHLPGKEGVIEEIRKKGYTVTVN